MHPDLAPHLHTPECNELIEELHRCHRENAGLKFFGWCSKIDTLVGKCLDKERAEKRRKNAELAKQRYEKIHGASASSS